MRAVSAPRCAAPGPDAHNGHRTAGQAPASVREPRQDAGDEDEETGGTPPTGACCRPSPIAVDSRRSWLVAGACAWVMFCTLLINRSSGVVFISLNREFNMTREQAATPFSMLGAVSNIFAVVSGYMIRHMPLAAVSFLGTVLCSVGIFVAGSAYSPLSITYAIGIITACGQSLIFSSNMVAVNTYFKVHRTTASGVSYTGGTLVSFIIPFAFEALEKRFGLKTTLLMIAAVTLNALLGAVVFLAPPRVKKPDASQSTSPTSRRTRSGSQALPRAGESLNGEHTKEDTAAGHDLTSTDQASQPRSSRVSISLCVAQFAFVTRPIFHLIVISGVIFAYVLVLFNVTIVAFAREKRLSDDQSMVTLWFYAGGDFIGRLFSGQLSDRGWMRRRTVMALAFSLTACATLGLAFVTEKIPCFAFCFLYGLCAGSTMILFSVLLTEYLGLKNLPLAIGVHCLVNGLAALPRQHLIKHFTASGSYWTLYMFMCLISVVAAAAWSSHCVYLSVGGRVARARLLPPKPDAGAARGVQPEEIRLREKLRGDRAEDDGARAPQAGDLDS